MDLRITHYKATSTSLCPPGRFFRYLVLQPASKDDDRLVCTLEISELGGVSFEAISYVWGSNVKDKTIICNGQGLAITTSLYHVLMRLRRPVGPRTLWADAICINQDNVTEKGHQVGFMSDIYPKARRVLVHLGPKVVPQELGWIMGAYHPRRAKELIEESGPGRRQGQIVCFPPASPSRGPGRTCHPRLYQNAGAGLLGIRDRVHPPERGYFALVPGETMKGDVCAVVFGTKSPFVLRPGRVQDRFLVVGDMWMAGRKLAVNRLHGGVKAFIFGSEESKDWVDLGLEEQEIHLCGGNKHERG